MPGDKKHHTDKFRRCVEEVKGKGHSEDSAYAICTTSLQNAGEPIFEGAESRSAEEFRLLEGGVQRELHLCGATGVARHETLNGRRHLVVPIVALMEGVIHPVNAETPEFVSADVLKRAAASWVGKPGTLGHPKKNGTQCSASDAEVRKAAGIGVLMKSEYKDKKLLQEAWIDEEKGKQLHPSLYKDLEDGKPVEVSVGAFVVTRAKESDFNGKKYKAEWLEVQGDHLAFLPGGRGACSCEMGCGTHRAAGDVEGHPFHGNQWTGGGPHGGERVVHKETGKKGYVIERNYKKKVVSVKYDSGHLVEENISDLKPHRPKGLEENPLHFVAAESIELLPLQPVETFTALQGQSLTDRIQAVNAAVSDRWPEPAHAPGVPYEMAYPLQVFDDRVIVQKGQETYACDYTVDKDGTVTLGEPRPVKQKWVDAAAYMMEDCPTCHGTGQVKTDGKQSDCSTCDGEGKVKMKAAAGARHSASDMKMIQTVHDHAVNLGAVCDRKNLETAEHTPPVISPVVRREGTKWVLYSTDGKRRLATHNTEAEAKTHEQAIKTAAERRERELAKACG